MTKRIVSGIFILTALGALGVILAGALTSGEQLIVRFLTAVIVAALGLYVISDLRLQADDDARSVRPTENPWPKTIEAPPNSTAAFMATITRHGGERTQNDGSDLSDVEGFGEQSKSGTAQIEIDPDGPAEDERIAPIEVGVGTTSSSTSEHTESAVVEGAGSRGGPPVPSPIGAAPVTVRADDLAELQRDEASSLEARFDPQPTGEAWPTAEPVVTLSGDDRGPTEDATSAGIGSGPDQADGLTADEPATGMAVAGFEYSGEIDVLDIQWPAAPDLGEPGDGHLQALDPGVVQIDLPKIDLPQIAIEGAPATDPDAGSAPDLPGDDLDPPTPADTDPVPDPASEAELAPETGAEGGATMPGEPSGIVPVATVTEGEPADEMQPSAESRLPSGPIPAGVGDMAACSDQPVEEFESYIGGNGVHRSLPSPFLDHSSLSAADYADAPLAPIIDLRDVAPTTDSSIESAISAGEVEVITALIAQGMLSTDGPISDRDVRTMVYVAFTSNELRKLLLAGGNPEGPSQQLDLGPVELFSRGIEAPQTLYPGLPVQSEARSQLG